VSSRGSADAPGDWFDRLCEVIATHDNQPFAWGAADCFNFAMDAVEAMTGEDPYVADRRISSEAEYKAALKRRGFRSIESALKAAFPSIPPAMAATRDLALVKTETGALSVGVVAGADILARDQDRLARLPLTSARRAYRVE
jgi:hypothetical protein